MKPRELKDGHPADSKSFDVPYLEVVTKGALVLDDRHPRNPARPGGPKPHVTRDRDVTQ